MLEIDRETFSPGVRQKVELTAMETKSFERAERVLRRVGEIQISGRHVGRIAGERGRQLRDEQHERADRHEQGQLPVEVSNPPELAVVEMDGGRIRTRQAGHGSGTHAPAWRETKTPCFCGCRANSTPTIRLRNFPRRCRIATAYGRWYWR